MVLAASPDGGKPMLLSFEDPPSPGHKGSLNSVILQFRVAMRFAYAFVPPPLAFVHEDLRISS